MFFLSQAWNFKVQHFPWQTIDFLEAALSVFIRCFFFTLCTLSHYYQTRSKWHSAATVLFFAHKNRIVQSYQDSSRKLDKTSTIALFIWAEFWAEWMSSVPLAKAEVVTTVLIRCIVFQNAHNHRNVLWVAGKKNSNKKPNLKYINIAATRKNKPTSAFKQIKI